MTMMYGVQKGKTIISSDFHYFIMSENQIIKEKNDLVIKKFETDNHSLLKFIDIAIDKEGSIVVIGEGFVKKKSYPFILKLDSDLYPIEQCFCTKLTERFTSVIVNDDNNYIVIGKGNGLRKGLLIEFNSNLKIINRKDWECELKQGISFKEHLFLIGSTQEGSVIVKMDKELNIENSTIDDSFNFYYDIIYINSDGLITIVGRIQDHEITYIGYQSVRFSISEELKLLTLTLCE